MTIMKKIRAFARNEDGASLAEYAILLAILGTATIAALGLLQTNINTRLNDAAGVIGTGLTPGS